MIQRVMGDCMIRDFMTGRSPFLGLEWICFKNLREECAEGGTSIWVFGSEEGVDGWHECRLDTVVERHDQELWWISNWGIGGCTGAFRQFADGCVAGVGCVRIEEPVKGLAPEEPDMPPS